MRFKTIIPKGFFALVLFLLFAAPAWAVNVNFNVSGYNGAWAVNSVPGAQFGDQTLDLAPGNHAALQRSTAHHIGG